LIRNPPLETDESVTKFSFTAEQLENENLSGVVFSPQYFLLEEEFAAADPPDEQLI